MSARMQLTEAEVEFDDLGSGLPILLLHGFPATRYLWSQVVPVLVSQGIASWRRTSSATVPLPPGLVAVSIWRARHGGCGSCSTD